MAEKPQHLTVANYSSFLKTNNKSIEFSDNDCTFILPISSYTMELGVIEVTIKQQDDKLILDSIEILELSENCDAINAKVKSKVLEINYFESDNIIHYREINFFLYGTSLALYDRIIRGFCDDYETHRLTDRFRLFQTQDEKIGLIDTENDEILLPPIYKHGEFILSKYEYGLGSAHDEYYHLVYLDDGRITFIVNDNLFRFPWSKRIFNYDVERLSPYSDPKSHYGFLVYGLYGPIWLHLKDGSTLVYKATGIELDSKLFEEEE